MFSIQSQSSLHSQVLYNLRNEKNEPTLDFSSVEQFEKSMINRKDWHNSTDEIGVINRPLGKVIEKLSSDAIKEMSEDGISNFDIKSAFSPLAINGVTFEENLLSSTALNANFEGSSFVIKNQNFIESSVVGFTNSSKYFEKKLLDSDIYKNFEPLEDVYQSTTFLGANDKMSRFKEVIGYAILNNATEAEIANKDFQLEAQNVANELYQFGDLSYIVMKENKDDTLPQTIDAKNPLHTMIESNYNGLSKENIETLKKEILQDAKKYFNKKETQQDLDKKIDKFFNPTLEEVQKNASGEGVYASKTFDSISDVLDFIKEKKEYLKEHFVKDRTNIQLDFLTRLEEKLMEDISTVSMKSDVKFENGMIIGQLYG